MTAPTARSGVSATRSHAPVAVLGDRLVGVQVERDDERARAVGRRQRRRLPAARGQPQRRVLELRLGRRQRRRQLAEHLRVRVQRVARRAPCVRSSAGQGEDMAGNVPLANDVRKRCAG